MNQTPVKFSNDPEFQNLEIPNTCVIGFKFFPDETIRGVAFIVKAPHPVTVQGLYFTIGPRSHSNLCSFIPVIDGVRVPTARTYHDESIEFGFYTNKGRFFNRRLSSKLVQRNRLDIANKHFDPRIGLLSSDVWANVN